MPSLGNCTAWWQLNQWLTVACVHGRLDEIIVFRQLTKGEVKQIADIMLSEVFKRAEEKEIKIDVTERFKVLSAVPQDQLVHGVAMLYGLDMQLLVLCSMQPHCVLYSTCIFSSFLPWFASCVCLQPISHSWHCLNQSIPAGPTC